MYKNEMKLIFPSLSENESFARLAVASFCSCVNMDIEDLTDIKIKKPLIVLFISGNSKICDKIGTDIAVVHMGFLLPGGILRHASKIKKSVVDTDFEEYINKLKQNKNNIGIALVKIK